MEETKKSDGSVSREIEWTEALLEASEALPEAKTDHDGPCWRVLKKCCQNCEGLPAEERVSYPGAFVYITDALCPPISRKDRKRGLTSKNRPPCDQFKMIPESGRESFEWHRRAVLALEADAKTAHEAEKTLLAEVPEPKGRYALGQDGRTWACLRCDFTTYHKDTMKKHFKLKHPDARKVASPPPETAHPEGNLEDDEAEKEISDLWNEDEGPG